MIPITPEIIGPGIEEDYRDALVRIEKMLQLMKDTDYGNDTCDGRVKFELSWLRQEILAGRLPLPAEHSWVATISYSHADGGQQEFPGFFVLCEELLIVLREGLVKPRHYPVVAAMIEDILPNLVQFEKPPFICDPQGVEMPVDPAMLQNELSSLSNILIDRSTGLPLSGDQWPAIQLLGRLRGYSMEFTQKLMQLGWVVNSGVRPLPCLKGPLPAPSGQPLMRELRND